MWEEEPEQYSEGPGEEGPIMIPQGEEKRFSTVLELDLSDAEGEEEGEEVIHIGPDDF